jgi:hypothetical protein
MGRPYAFISQGLLSTKAHRRISGEQYAKAMLSHITVPFEAGTDASPPFCLCRAAKSTLHYQRRPLSKLGTVSYCRDLTGVWEPNRLTAVRIRIASGGTSTDRTPHMPPCLAGAIRLLPEAQEPPPRLRRGGSQSVELSFKKMPKTTTIYEYLRAFPFASYTSDEHG